MTALVGLLNAAADAARYTRDGMSTAARRAARAGSGLNRRASASAVESGRRANLALQVLRGMEVQAQRDARAAYRRRSSEYVAAGFVAGAAGGYVYAALRRGAFGTLDDAAGRRSALHERLRQRVTAVQRNPDAVSGEPDVASARAES